jgi:hypothetical protein
MQMLVIGQTLKPYQARFKVVLAQLRPARFVQFVKQRSLAFVAFLAAFVGIAYPQLVSHASTTLTIDTNVLFSAVNGWITTFLPIAAIGLGIAIALAVIAFVGDAILQGFKGRH